MIFFRIKQNFPKIHIIIMQKKKPNPILITVIQKIITVPLLQ